MEQLMDEINRVNGLKDNQKLSYEEKQSLIESCIRIYVAEKAAAAYKKGIADSLAAINKIK